MRLLGLPNSSCKQVDQLLLRGNMRIIVNVVVFFFKKRGCQSRASLREELDRRQTYHGPEEAFTIR